MFPVSSTRNMTNGTPFRVALGYMYVKSMKYFRTLALFAVILGSLAFPLLIGVSPWDRPRISVLAPIPWRLPARTGI